VAGGCRRLYNEELCSLYASPSVIRAIKSRRMKCAGHVACVGEMRNASKILLRKPEGKIPRGRRKRRWEDNIRMDVMEVGLEIVFWIHLAHDRDQWRELVITIMNLGAQ